MAALLLFASASVSALSLPTVARTTMPLNVYIEDTDAYGVVFYANYLKFFERAAMAAVGAEAIGAARRRSPDLLFGLHSADGLRYSVPATLGDACDVSLELLGVSAGKLAAKAALVRRSDGKELFTAADLRFGFVEEASGRAARACDTWPLPADAADAVPDDPCGPEAMPRDAVAPEASASPALAPPGLTLNLDEASAAGGVSLHAALRYFERHRTTYLGGPGALGALRDAGVNVVVGRVSRLVLLEAAHGVGVGSPLQVRCKAKLRARGSQVIFDQWLVHGRGDVPLARAEITCLVLHAETGKIVPAPPEVMQHLEPWL